MIYSHQAIEEKWQKEWEKNKTYQINIKNFNQKKSYILDMFPYPSGAGLHVGHPKGYTATDVYARYRRLCGDNVLHPIGWDAFGLPAEQYALTTGKNPAQFTLQNIDNFRKQLKSLGFSFDYNGEVNTTDPKYYRLTQWIFKKLYEQGLAEIKDVNVNWCQELKTVLANEEVLNIDGKMVSERGNFEVIKKPMKQWVLKITHYAEKLLSGLDRLDWPESVKNLQRNWIGKSEGVLIDFILENDKIIKIFTTKPETIFGVTYLVLAPEHEIVLEITTTQYIKEVEQYLKIIKSKNDLQRTDLNDEKTGVFTGSYAIHPLTNEKIPIWIADYVLATYATGAVMAVPSLDQRDKEFAKKYHLSSLNIIENDKLINSQFLNNFTVQNAREIIINKLNDAKLAKKHISYKLRDWLFSRQRYWGEPFPIIFWEDGSIGLVPDEELPLILPIIKDIQPSDSGYSPLINAHDWVNVTREDGMKGKRETNTMPQWAGSCWYYIAYILKNDDGTYLELDSKEAAERLKYWLPVDLYIGGQEHAVLHLLYARFWHQVLYDLKIVHTPEPFIRLFNQGMILGENGNKMSKSKGNVINPDDIVESHGADALRLYEMFMGPLDASLPWSNQGLDGMRKWLARVYRLIIEHRDWIIETNDNKLDYEYHQMVKRCQELIENLNFNNAISQMMIFINECYKTKTLYFEYALGFLIILSCFAPHLSEELYSKLKPNKINISIINQKFPQYDKKYLIKKAIIVAVQINGKLRAKLDVIPGTSSEELSKLAKLEVKNFIFNKKIIKEIIVIDKIVNLVIK